MKVCTLGTFLGGLHVLLFLAVEVRDLFQAEKEIMPRKAEQIYKRTIIFPHNNNLVPFFAKIVVILWICSAQQTIISFSAWVKSQVTRAFYFVSVTLDFGILNHKIHFKSHAKSPNLYNTLLFYCKNMSGCSNYLVYFF